MTILTPILGLPKPEGSDNARDYLKGTIAGGGLHAALDKLDGMLSAQIVDAKGDLLFGTANNTIARKPIGAAGSLLVADPGDPTGAVWTNTVASLAVTGALTAGAGTAFGNAQLGPDVARANQLVNGGFEVWQRGTGSFTAGGAYAADRWSIALATSTVSVSQIPSTIGSKGRSAQLTYTHAGVGSASLWQQLRESAAEHLQLLGKQVTLSVKVKSTVAGTVRLYAYDAVAGWSYSAYNVGTGEETLTLTATIAPTGTNVQVGIQLNVASCVVEVNDAMLVLGSVATNYVPLHPAEDLARCLRYYEVHGGGSGLMDFRAYGAAGGIAMYWQRFASRKAVTPTVTKAGTWGVTNCGQPLADTPSVEGYRFYVTVSALGSFAVQGDTADDTITAEANP
jgi:hypothetical protein